MTQELTIDAVRLALGMYQLRAQVAGLNIANAGTPGGRASRIDFAPTRQVLDSAAQGDGAKLAAGIEALSHVRSAPTPCMGSSIEGTRAAFNCSVSHPPGGQTASTLCPRWRSRSDRITRCFSAPDVRALEMIWRMFIDDD